MHLRLQNTGRPEEPIPVFALETLAEIVARRAESDAGASYTRSLLEKGVARCAKKFGEEATELVIAAVAEDERALRFGGGRRALSPAGRLAGARRALK